MEKVIDYEVTGIKCDAKGCGYRDRSFNFDVKQLDAHIDLKCPDCEAPLMTKEDIDSMKIMIGISDVMNAAGVDGIAKALNVPISELNGPLFNVEVDMDGSGKMDLKEPQQIKEG